MAETNNLNDLRTRVLRVLSDLSGLDFSKVEINDRVKLEELGIDYLDKNNSLPLDLQQEFEVYFGTLSAIDTIGDLVTHVQEVVENKIN